RRRSLHLRRPRLQEPPLEGHRLRGHRLRPRLPARVLGGDDGRGHAALPAGAVGESPSTRARIPAAGQRRLPEPGFQRGAGPGLCRAARVNVAAVNYHFGDKLGLYQEILQGAIDAMRATTEAARAAGEGLSAEDRLRRYVAVFVGRLLAAGSAQVHRLIHREMNDPTPFLDRLVEEGVRPRLDYL